MDEKQNSFLSAGKHAAACYCLWTVPNAGFSLARRHRGPRNKLLGCVSSFSLPLWRCFCRQGLSDRLHDETEQGGGNDADSIGQCMHGGSCERREGRF